MKLESEQHVTTVARVLHIQEGDIVYMHEKPHYVRSVQHYEQSGEQYTKLGFVCAEFTNPQETQYGVWDASQKLMLAHLTPTESTLSGLAKRHVRL